MRYVEYNVWNGKIFQVSSVGILPTKSTNTVKQIEDPIIEQMSADKRSLESAFIGLFNKAHDKDGTIHLIKNEKELTKIPIKVEGEFPDVSLILYTNNKLLEIIINYKAVKTWYNHRMRDRFKFALPFDFNFSILDATGNTLKNIKVPAKSFSNNFQTIVDLNSIDYLDDIQILTNRLFETYSLEFKKNKYFSLTSGDTVFNKATSVDKKNHNIIISKTNDKNKIMLEINKLDVSTIYKSLDFYITGKDPNELHGIIAIPIEDLWNKRSIVKEIKIDLEDKLIWCNNRTISILLNKKVMSI